MVLQGWFDESGKGQGPVYLLAGYVGKKDMWEISPILGKRN